MTLFGAGLIAGGVALLISAFIGAGRRVSANRRATQVPSGARPSQTSPVRPPVQASPLLSRVPRAPAAASMPTLVRQPMGPQPMGQRHHRPWSTLDQSGADRAGREGPAPQIQRSALLADTVHIAHLAQTAGEDVTQVLPPR